MDSMGWAYARRRSGPPQSPMNTKLTLLTTVALTALALSGCTTSNTEGTITDGVIIQTGSSTVFPVAELWAADWGVSNGIDVQVSSVGSSNGAKALCNGEADIADMSRVWKQKDFDYCASVGNADIDVWGWVIGYDGLSVVVSDDNTFAKDLSVAQLQAIFSGDARKWNEVDASFPNRSINLYIPDDASGTFEFFGEEILGECGEEICPHRKGDGVQQSDNDNELANILQDDEYGIGYFGFAYVGPNDGKVKPVKVNGVMPSASTIASGAYSPLARNLFIVTDGHPEGILFDYFQYALDEGQELVEEVDYVALLPSDLQKMRNQLENAEKAKIYGFSNA